MHANESGIPLRPFYGFSPVIKSLHVDFLVLLSSQFFDLILSFPHLKDLTVISYTSIDEGDGPVGLPTMVQPSTPLPTILTESFQGIRGPLSLLGGIHFRKLSSTWTKEEDPLLIVKLVDGRAHTLEAPAITTDLLLFLGGWSARPPSTSPRRENSKTWRSSVEGNASSGLLWRSELPHTTEGISNRSHFTSPTYPLTCIASGWSLTSFSSNSGSRTRFVRRLRATHNHWRIGAVGQIVCCDNICQLHDEPNALVAFSAISKLWNP